MTVRVRAYAKLNLFLDVCGLRSDGFHDIYSHVQTIDLADVIEIRSATDIQILCSEPVDGANIVDQATRALLREKQSQAGIHITIEKHIPMGAGLGGGSSDAAATLAIVNQLIPPQLPAHRITKIASEIGSDVQLFLRGGCMELSGRGDPGRALPNRSESFVLLVPPLHCSTRDIYKMWRPSDGQETRTALGQNDLFHAAMRIYPELGGYRDVMDGLGGLYSGMTGSGSAFFAAFSNREEAARAQDELTRHRSECRVYCCQPTASGYAQERGEV